MVKKEIHLLKGQPFIFFMKNLRNGKNMTEPQIMSIFPKPQLNRAVAIPK